MKLEADHATVIPHDRVGRSGTLAERAEPRRKRIDTIAVAHPDPAPVWYAVEHTYRFQHVQQCWPELAFGRRRNHPPHLLRQQLHPITDAEQWNAGGE
jgi:hypothetical protein